MKLPTNYKQVYDRHNIAQAVSRLGGQVSQWAREVRQTTGRDLVVLPILRGGIFFFADLVRELDLSVEIAPIHASVYDQQHNNVQLKEASVKVEGVDIHRRGVLIVDDVCDSGKTLSLLKPKLENMGAAQVRTAVLIHRKLQQEHVFNPDWVGFVYDGPEWFVGYGMDDQGQWRNLSSIYIMQ